MILAARDRFGSRRRFYHPDSGHVATSIAGVLRAAGVDAGPPDPIGIAGFLTHARAPGRTVLRDVRAVPPGHALVRRPDGLALRPVPALPAHDDVRTLLRAALQQTLQRKRSLAVALSGGLDSALLLALLHELGARDVPAYVLVTGMPGYCEREAALAMARRLGAQVREVKVHATDFVAALPSTIQAVEEPLFNLHPVAKRLLAEAMAADGIEAAITGDGADQVLRRDMSANYLPLCKALFNAAGVSLVTPFLDTAVVRRLLREPPDPDKRCLREIGHALGLPDRLVRGPKHSRLAPDMDLGLLVGPERIHALARALNMPPPNAQDSAQTVLWTTLALTLDHLAADLPVTTP